MFLSDGWIFLLASCKRKWNKSPNYMITTKYSDFDVKGEGYIGNLQFRTKPKSEKSDQFQHTARTLRSHLHNLHIDLLYNSLREMTILIPLLSTENIPFTWKTESLLDQYKTDRSANMLVFHSNTAMWNPKLGRVHEPSVKAFQVLSPQNTDQVLLQFGKATEKHYNLDANWPFSLYRPTRSLCQV